MRNFQRTLLFVVFVMTMLFALASCSGECAHENTEVQDAVAATCTTAGHTGKTVCKDCEATISEGSVIEKIAHTYNAGVVTTEPTCGATGVKTFTCTACSATTTETVAATGNHSYDNGAITKEATCYQTGVKTFTCTVCASTNVESIAVVPHADIYHDALDNTHSHTCIHCTMNEYESHTPVDAGTHYDATCLEPAYTILTCADCDGEYKVYDEGGEALGHSYGAWTVTLAATCKAEGETAHTCDRCGDTETIVLSVNPNAHTYNDGMITTDSTCCSTGVKTYTCMGCGDSSKTETVAIKNHEFDAGEGDGSGWVVQTCTTCTVDTPATRKYYDASTLKKAELTVADIPTDSDVELGMENATIQVPQEVVSQLGTAEKVEIKADFIEDTAKDSLLTNSTKLTDEERARLENVDIYDFGISVGGTSIGDFDAKVTVTIPYTLKDGEDAEGILIWYVKDDGEITHETAVYNATTESVTFSVSHFSYYAVAYQETQAMKCRRGVHKFEATSITSTPSCTSYGYTVYECSYCHHVELGNFAPKLDHAWGDVQQPTVTCTEGGYAYRECATCKGHLEVTYVRAKGHTVTGMATCESGVSCTVCNMPVKPALGHKFSEWTVTVTPTAISEGEKTRSCLTCGKKETVTLAKEGTVEAYEFSTVDDLYIFIFREMSGFEKGQLVLAFDMGGRKIDATIDFDTTNDKLTFVMESKVTTPNGTDEPYVETIANYYDGARVFSDTNGEVYVTDLEGMMTSQGITVEFIMGLMEEAFELANPYVEEYLGVASDVLAVLPTEAAEKLATYVDAIETVYAYYALRLGFDTNMTMVEGVSVPTAKDYATFIEALMTGEENGDGTTTYTFTDEKIYALIDEITTYLDDNAETAMGKLVYDAIADTVKEIYPDVTDYTTLIAKLKTEFPGTMTVKDALLKLTQIALSSDMTMQDIYEAINVVLNMNAPEGSDPVSSETQFAQMFTMTLNDVVTMLMTDPEAEEPSTVTVEELLAMVEAMAATKLSEISIPIPSGNPDAEPTVITAAMISETLKGVKAQFDLDLGITVVLDAAGNLVSADLGLGLSTVVPDEAPAGTQPTTFVTGSVSFKNEADLTPPASLDEYVGIDVKTSFDEKGNLIVSGIDSDLSFVFELNGTHTYQLSDLLVKDTALSAELGYDVWKLDARYSNDSLTSFNLCIINGKYYTYEYVNEFLTETKVEERVALNTFLADPSSYLPDADAKSIGYLVSGTRDNYYESDDGFEDAIPVYYTYGGAVYKDDGVWYLISITNSAHETYHIWDDEADEDYYRYVFFDEELVSAPYADVMAGASLTTFADGWYSYDYGNNDAIRWFYGDIFGYSFIDDSFVVGLANDDYVSFGLIYCLAEREGDKINLVLPENRIDEDDYYYRVGNEVDIDNLEALLDSGYGVTDSSKIHITTDDDWWSYGTFVMNGVVRPEKRMEMLNVEFHVAEYFRKVEDGVYVSLGISGKNSSYIGFADVSTFEKMTVNGKTFYKKGESGSYVYGYVELPEGDYAQACVKDGVLMYRGQESELRASLDDIFDVEDYVSKASNNYVIDASLFKSLDELLNEDESFNLTLVDDGTNEDVQVEIPFYSTAETPDITVQDIINEMMGEMMGGGSSGGSGDYTDWWSWFSGSSYYGVSVSPNADGTVSVFSASGEKIKLEYSGKNFLVGPFATQDEQKSAQEGYDIYNATEITKNNTVSFVKLGGKYYNYTTRSEYSLSYYSSASAINCKNWELRSLTLAIPAESADTNPYDIFVGDVVFPNIDTNSHEFYFIYDGGVLKVLTGVDRQGGETDAISYEGAVAASTYFASLKAVVNPEYYYYSFDCYVNGVEKYIYKVRVNILEPATLGGYTEDTVVAEDYVRATKNGSRFSYIKSLEWLDETKLILGSEYKPETGWIERDEGVSTYANGTFQMVDFYSESETTREYVMLGGKLYHTYIGWKNNIYSDLEMKAALYDTVYLWVDNNGDGTVYVADEDGYELVPYEGDLNIANADVTTPNVTNGEKTYTKYTFYVSTDDVPVTVTTIDGYEVHYNNTGNGYIEVKEGKYVRAYLNTWGDTPTVQYLTSFDLGYASSATVAESDVIKENVSSKSNGRVIVLEKGVLELLGEDFSIVVYDEKGSHRGSIWYDELVLAFDRAEILANGGSLVEDEGDETLK